MRLYPSLKIFRTITAVITILLISFTFFDIYGIISPTCARYMALTQFIPSLLSFINLPSMIFLSFAAVILLTLISGRSYCSFICPLGIFQDIVVRAASAFRIKKNYRYAPPHGFFRYSILLIVSVSYAAGGTLLITWLDPFSIYGRFASGILSPAVTSINNIAAATLSKFNFYAIHSVDIKYSAPVLLFIISTMMLSITILAVFKGRLYCNTICPVGALLGIAAKFSLFKIEIDKRRCIGCGSCEKVCKSSCIGHENKLIDFSRCVSCFNCLNVCPNSSIKFKSSRIKKSKTEVEMPEQENFKFRKENIKIARRTFIAGMFFLPSILPAQESAKKKVLYIQDRSKQKEYKKKIFTPPPGSGNIERFNESCTACSLCISRCPTSVLQPAVMQYGMHGIMQPYLDFNTGYCNYDCTICGEACPTGAIRKTTVEEKHLIRTGNSVFIKENCITFTNGTACGACSEHCPTKAVNMIPFRGNLVIPEVNVKICTGCGACEYVCPVRPLKAIYVEGNKIHEKAELPKKETPLIIKKEDFPF